MLYYFLIAICFSIGFFFESIFGFGGGLIAYSLIGFFVDIKKMILLGLYIGTLSSFYIFITSYKNLDKKIFYKLIPIALIGSIIGVVGFINLPRSLLSLIFGVILLLLATKILFFDKYNFPKIFKTKLLLIGAISQGSFGVGGPFVVNAINNEFKSKSSLRATMALYFVFCNIIRIIQIFIIEKNEILYFTKIWWIIIPVFISIYLGHLVHIKIRDNYFKRGIAIITILASINFIMRAFLIK